MTLPSVFTRLPLAHRGLHDRTARRPENSRAAFRAAMAQGYGIEMDLQLSEDGRAIVFHDDDLDRLTGASGPVRSRTAQELGQIPLRDSDEGIPTLSEVLNLVGGQVPLLIELKDQHGALGNSDGQLEQAAARDLAGYDGAVAVMSFNPDMIRQFALLAPDLPRGFVTCDFAASDWPGVPEDHLRHIQTIPLFDAVGACFVSHDVNDIDAAPVAALKARGVPVLCWTVRSPEIERQARRVADNITFEGYAAALPV